MPADEVQRFSEFDEHGRSMREHWQTTIDDATKRLGGADDNRCRVTVTDRFGGRGHDFQVADKESNANGGMLVVATSIPDEREWIQWKGRTARQDRPGQFVVLLNSQAKPLSEPKAKRALAKLRRPAVAGSPGGSVPKDELTEDGKIELMLDMADEGIGERLKEFGTEQASGEALNELTEKYYKRYPRSFDDPWPLPAHEATDAKLRIFLTQNIENTPSDIRKKAKAEFEIELDPPR